MAVPEDDRICVGELRPHSGKAPLGGTGIVNHGEAVSTEIYFEPLR
jgi:hypothetical protein